MTNRFILLLAVICCTALIGCSDSGGPAQSVHATSKPGAGEPAVNRVNVKIHPVTVSDFTEQARVSGQTLADKDIIFSAEVAGRLETLTVDLGDTVRAGEVFARVDYQMLKARADQAQASYDLAVKTYNRLEALRKDELITQQMIDEAKAQMDSANAQLESAKINLEQSLIRSNINGTVVQKFVESGEYVGPGAPVIRVVDFSSVIVEAQLPERTAPRVKPDSRVTVTIDALDESFEGHVEVVVPTSDPASKTFLLRVVVDNANQKILVGMAATLTIDIAKYTDVVVVPQDSVIMENGSRAVFVEDAGVARRREVKLGPTRESSVLIWNGLNAGDHLIVVGHRDLVDGQPVQVRSS